jgi:hypothetical protein
MNRETEDDSIQRKQFRGDKKLCIYKVKGTSKNKYLFIVQV